MLTAVTENPAKRSGLVLGLTADNSIIKHFETISGLTKSRAWSKLFGVRLQDNWSMPIEWKELGPSADILFKHWFGPISGPTKPWAWSASKHFDTMMQKLSYALVKHFASEFMWSADNVHVCNKFWYRSDPQNVGAWSESKLSADILVVL